MLQLLGIIGHVLLTCFGVLLLRQVMGIMAYPVMGLFGALKEILDYQYDLYAFDLNWLGTCNFLDIISNLSGLLIAFLIIGFWQYDKEVLACH